ncbi:glutamic acid-rich protein-like isoform X2 [Macrobrachium nipponense]|uniref:glutamic acid-rich protein-like isoform X2 n=1 Tax=Macrobrachium nipponense TaxID=159736 RepID=UPI0030C81531
MHRNQNRSRSRDNFGNNRNRQRNNDNRRRDDFDRNSGRFQGGGGRRDGQGNQMSQMDRGSFGLNTGGYNQGMGMYGNNQNQMVGFGGGFGGSGFQQQNRFGINPQQMINPWASTNMMAPSMGASGDEAKLAMNILNAVLSSSGPQASGRGMSPPPNKMRRMDLRVGLVDTPLFSKTSYFDSSVRTSRLHTVTSSSVDENSEFVFRKRLTFEERERETKKYKDLPAKALKCRMCEKSVFHNVMAYLAHIDSKGHNKVARAYHEKIAASANLMKQTARLALQKEMKKAKAQGLKVVEKECRVCEGPMIYGNLKHKNILACKILHKHHNQTLCCGKDHKTRSMVEEHCLSLAHLKAKFESDAHDEDKEASEGERGTTEEFAEDEEESKKRLKRDVARRKRKFGDDETDEDEEEEEEEKTGSDHQDEKQEVDKNKEEEEEKDNSEHVNGNDTEEKDSEEVEQMETEADKEESKEEVKEVDPESKEEQMETDVKKDEDSNEKDDDSIKKERSNQNQTKVNEESDNVENDDEKSRGNRKKDNKAKLKKEKDNKYQGKTLQQLTYHELLEFHKKNMVDDPEKLMVYDPAQPTGLNYIDTRVSYHCMACLEYCPAFPDDLTAHSCSKEHYDLFRSKYMKVKGVRDSPTSLRRLKNLGKKKEDDKDKKDDSKDNKTKEDTNDNDDENIESEKTGDEKAGSNEKAASQENEEVGGDDALYDPYEGESGDLTTMLQEKQAASKQEAESTTGYEGHDEAHESEAENYEDNILDYEEEDVEDDDKEEKDHGEEKENQGENEEYNENEEYQDDENNEGDNDNANEEVEANEDEEEYGNDDEAEGNEYGEEYENENQEYDDNEEYAEQVEDEEEQQEEEDEEEVEEEEEEVEEVPQPTARRGRSRRAF